MNSNKLNFGCGRDILKGFDNVDIQKEAEIPYDLNDMPYTFAKENTYEYVWAYSVLEYLDNPENALNELWRICKPNAIIELRVPYYFNKGVYNEMQVKHYFSDKTFEVFVTQPNLIRHKQKFKIKELKLIPSRFGRFIPSNWFRKKLGLFVSGLIESVHVKLEVIKE